MKKVLSFFIAISMLFSAVSVTAESQMSQREEVKVFVGGEKLEFDQPPVIVDGRTLVPLRAIFEALGATVDWNGETQTVTAVRGSTKIRITIGDNKLYAGDGAVELDVPAQIINDRTLVPVRAISESFGCEVGWDGDTRTVSITDDDYIQEDQTQSSQISDDEILENILQQNGLADNLYYFPDDYDGDGHKEAFIITGTDGSMSEYYPEYRENVSVYFINTKGNCIQLVSDLYGMLGDTIQAGSHKYITWTMYAGGSGSSEYVFGCKNGEPYEPEISRQYNIVKQDEDGNFYGNASDYSEGHRWIDKQLWYDEINGEFYEI